MAKKKLTDKQETFCKEYILDLNATQAAIRAGYSEKTAKEIGSENLTKPNIQERVQKLKAKRSEKLEITSESVLQELYNWAYGDFTEFMELSLSELKVLPKDLRKLITGFDRTITKHGKSTTERIKVTFVSKERAMDMIARHLPDFYAPEKRQVTHTEQPFFPDEDADSK